VCLFAKVSREHTLCTLRARGRVEQLREFGEEMSRCMLNINWGQQRESDDDGYFIVGERANRNATGIGEYKPKPNITNEKIDSLRTTAGGIVLDVETNVRPFSRYLQLEESVAQQVREGRNLNIDENIQRPLQWVFRISQNAIPTKLSIILC